MNISDSLLSVNGVRLVADSIGIYTKKRHDLSLIEIADGSLVSVVFTQNKFCAAPVIIAKQHSQKVSPKYLIINAGIANAGTGEMGIEHAVKTCKGLATLTGCHFEHVLPFSTGIIGQYLPIEKIIKKLPALLSNLSIDNWSAVAKAIMTTDTVAKGISKKIKIEGHDIVITGIAKGAGMIRPNMATMLSFIATDIAISKALLDKALKQAVNKSFNRITVDGDTSTNDACTLISTAQARNTIIENEHSKDFSIFYNALFTVCSYLAKAIIRDGEGATKFVQISVLGGASSDDCLLIAYRIAQSPLVKTALTASDPNWGRILAAVGSAGIDKLDLNRVNIFIDDVCIVKNGQRANSYTEAVGKELFSQYEINIVVDLGMGHFQERVWTTDLSCQYITLNAEYRT